MIRSLMKQEVKANYKLYIVFLSIIAMYAVTLVAMYDPSLKDSLKSLEESMPVVLAAFGMQDMGTTLLDFIITYLYKFVLIVTPFIYSIVMCYRLLAKYVENGSLAYLLNSKHGRTKIVITQWVNLFLGVVVMIAFNTGLMIVCCSMMFKGALDIPRFLLLNLGLLALQLFIAAFCFMFACLFNDVKYSIGCGAGGISLFIIMQMFFSVYDNAKILLYCNPLSLFNPQQLVNGNIVSVISLVVLLGLTAIFLTIGLLGFRRKDLPL